MNKRKVRRKEVLGIIISSENKSDIGKIVKFSPAQIEKYELSNKIKTKTNDFLNPAHEEIMKVFNKYYSKKR